MPGTPGLAPEAASYAQSIALLAELEVELRSWLTPRGLSHLNNYLLKLAKADANLWEYENLLFILAERFCGDRQAHACRAVMTYCYAKARLTAKPPLNRLLGNDTPPGERFVPLEPGRWGSHSLVARKGIGGLDGSPSSRRHPQKYAQLGKNIAFFRRQSGLSQEELAELAGISRTHLSNIEAVGMDKSISLEVLFDIADVLDIEPRKLFMQC